MNIIYCTIAAANYLSRIQVLEKSLKKFNPAAELKILLCELPEVCNQISVKTGRKFYSPADIGCPDWLQMAFYYDITEYNTALKPFFLQKLIEEGYNAVFYFDPDIEIFSPLTDIEALVPRYDVVLTPHVNKPVFDDGKKPVMEEYIRVGQFNLGFLGISNSKESLELLKWWQDVCLEKCLFDKKLYFVDQFWAAIIPSFIEKTYILRDSACNVAYWNIFQRELKNENGMWTVDSKALKFFHFSGLSVKDLTRVSVHQNRVTTPVGSALHLLLSQYFEQIKNQEWSIYNKYPYSFSAYSNNELITNEDRKKYLLLNRIERKIFNPFENPQKIKSIIKIDLENEKIFGSSLKIKLYNFLNKSALIRNDYIRMYADVLRTEGFLAANFQTIRFIGRLLKISVKNKEEKKDMK